MQQRDVGSVEHMKERDVADLIASKLERTQAPFFSLCLAGEGVKDVAYHKKLDMLFCGGLVLEGPFESIESIESAQEAFGRVGSRGSEGGSDRG